MTEEEAVLVVARWDYDSKQHGELSIKRNEKLKLLDDSRLWWHVEKQNGQCGYVPSNYVKRDKLGLVERIRKGIDAKRGAKPGNRQISPRNSESSHPHTAQTGGEMPFSQLAWVMYHYKAAHDDELNLNKGERVNVLEKSGDGWWRGECNGESGWFPSNYVSEEDTSMPNSHGSSTSSKGDDNSIPDDFVLGVTTLYAFKKRNDEELDFELGEALDIISNPSDDQDWWRARNKLGQVGLVPSNYVKVKENADPVCPTKVFIEDAVPKPIDLGQDDNVGPPSDLFYDRACFHGRIRKQDAEDMLSLPEESGLFLIRESETMKGNRPPSPRRSLITSVSSSKIQETSPAETSAQDQDVESGEKKVEEEQDEDEESEGELGAEVKQQDDVEEDEGQLPEGKGEEQYEGELKEDEGKKRVQKRK